MVIVILCVLYSLCNVVNTAPAIMQTKFPQIPTPEALSFMKQYGYIEEGDGESEALYTEEGISEIIKTMQKFGGVPETGRIDNATMKLMKSRRCGVPDIVRNRRQKRFVLGSGGWEKRNITYFLANWSPRLGEEKVMRNIQRALDAWGGYGRLHFQRVYSPNADIIVAFGSGYHGDRFPFDGDGGILAHAFFPYEQLDLGGDIHFDNDEKWFDKMDNTNNDFDGIDFFTVALHELGHSLGLSHTPDRNAVMFPYYNGYNDSPQPQLGYDDILGMYELYIKRVLKEDTQEKTSDSEQSSTETYSSASDRFSPTTYSYPSSTFEPFRTTEEFANPPSTPDYTTSRRGRPTLRPSTTRTTDYPSTATTIRRRKPTYRPYSTTTTIYTEAFYPSSTKSDTVIYHGDDESVVDHKEHDDKHKIPKHTSPSLPNICDGFVDAVATLRNELFVFKDQFIWRFKSRGRLEDGYPVLLSAMFPNLPTSIKKVDAVYQRPDGYIVIFIGDKFWVHNGHEFVENSPQPLSKYGLPDYITNIDAIQSWARNRKTYIYKADRFWRYNETSKTLDEGYPLHMERWRGVPVDLDAATTWSDGVTYFFKGPLFWKFDNNWIAATDESPLPTAEIWFGCPEEPKKMSRLFPSNYNY